MAGMNSTLETQWSAGPRETDSPQDECGFVSVNTPGLNAGEIACRAVNELRNRGYESTGATVITSTIGGETFIKEEKGFGNGKVVFPDKGVSFGSLYAGHQSSAHARYSTQGTNELNAAQPHVIEVNTTQGVFQISHAVNGNLINTPDLAVAVGKKPGDYSSDSELAALLFADTLAWMANNSDKPVKLSEVVLATIPKFRGSFMGSIMMDGETVVYCDPHGLKPAVIGSLPNGGIIVASEVTALDANGAKVIREVEPGEIIVINKDGSQWHSERWTAPRPAGCILELLYIIKPSGVSTKAYFRGLEVETARRDAGRALASVAPVEADYVCGVPNSAVFAGQGYEEASVGLEYLQFLKARSLDKSFIAPTPELRRKKVREKLYVPGKDDPELTNTTDQSMGEKIKGKRLIVVEDSVIRGTTMSEVIAILREHEPSEIHLRIALDRVAYTCQLGVDMGDPDDLLAIQKTDQEMCDYFGVDSIAFLPVQKIKDLVLKERGDDFCFGCLTGEYPTDQNEHEDTLISIGLKTSR